MIFVWVYYNYHILAHIICHRFRAHFIELDASTVDFWPYQHVSASIAAYYSWEVTCNRYGKLNYSVLMHHWFTVFAALLILLGVYTPFATWYGFVQVSWCFPIGYAMAFRTTFSNKYADLMRRWFTFNIYWLMICATCNFTGQFYLLFMGFSTGRIAVASCITMMFTMAGWFYDDMQLLKALKVMSTEPYEDANFQQRQTTHRNVGGVK